MQEMYKLEGTVLTGSSAGCGSSGNGPRTPGDGSYYKSELYTHNYF